MPAADSDASIEITVFDFDGTITTKDTFALFLRYYAGTLQWAAKILSLLPIFSAYGLKIIDRNAVKAHVICLLYTSPSPRDATLSRMPSSA